MDSVRIIERIEQGELKIEEQFGAVKVRVELEAADSLGLLLKRVELESTAKPADVQSVLKKQAAAIVEGLAFLSELKVIEVDGVSNAVQIRSRKPAGDGYVEIILRGGNFLSLERKPAALHISRGDFERLTRDLTEIIG